MLGEHLNACKTGFFIDWLNAGERGSYTIGSLRRRLGFGWGSTVEVRRQWLTGGTVVGVRGCGMDEARIDVMG